MFENVYLDIVRAYGKGKRVRASDDLCVIWRSYGLQALLVYRFGRWLGRLRERRLGWAIAMPLYPAFWILTACIRKAYDIHLKQSADIAPGLYISHFGGIEVRNCRIGPHCAIYQQVKLGPAEATGKGPVIGERVFIGANARILADVSIGDGTAIGVGAVVGQDVPYHCLVLGNPGRVVQRDYDNSAVL